MYLDFTLTMYSLTMKKKMIDLKRKVEERRMKKVITIVISLILALAMFSGCTQKGFEHETAITVKALKIDGADATVENIKSGAYKVSRPFNIAVKEGLSEVAQDFVNYILSKEGQAVVEGAGYISAVTGESYSGIKPSGKVTVAGSSSVTPVMEKLKEAYVKLNPNAVIEINQSDSTTGVNSAIDGICDIGMASRALKTSEVEKGVTPTVIAIDGIAVIVNNDNPVTGMTKEEVTKIYIGEITIWSEIGNE